MMLEDLLEWVTREKVIRPAEFARKWGVSEALVLQMIDELARLGYLQPVETCKPEHCSGCSSISVCKKPGLKLWVRHR